MVCFRRHHHWLSVSSASVSRGALWAVVIKMNNSNSASQRVRASAEFTVWAVVWGTMHNGRLTGRSACFRELFRVREQREVALLFGVFGAFSPTNDFKVKQVEKGAFRYTRTQLWLGQCGVTSCQMRSTGSREIGRLVWRDNWLNAAGNYMHLWKIKLGLRLIYGFVMLLSSGKL